MKNLPTLLVSASLVVSLNGYSAAAQGKGSNSGPGSSIGQGHGQGVGHDHEQAKVGSDAKGTHDTHADWQTKFNQHVQNDTAFASKIQSLLPPGTDLKAAEGGFKNEGQFIAALHVSKNLGIPFDQLKAKMTGDGLAGQTDSSPMSLGKAIHALKPALTQDQANDQAKRAEKQATQTENAATKASE